MVRYFEAGRWPSDADGGFSTLELRDPDADNSVPEAWAASDETARSGWQTYTYRGLGTNTVSSDPSQYVEFLFGLLEAGQLLIDDIRVIQSPGTADAQSLIQNGTFDTDSLGAEPAKWRVIGNQHGTVVVDPDNPANQVLHLVATGATEHLHNNAGTTLKAGDQLLRRIEANAEYEISFRAKWLSGSNMLHTRLYFNRLARTTLLAAPNLHGTPGQVNSTFTANIGPTYDDLKHGPVIPDPGQAVTVSVAADDPDGVAAMTLWYSVSGAAWQSAAMTLGSDGRYAATVPGQDEAKVVQFYVEGRDGQGAVSMFPAEGPDSRALYKVQDGQANFDTGAHNFRIIMTPADTTWLHTHTNVQNNEAMPVTVVYDEHEVYYDAAVRLKGSERGRDQPIRVGFLVKFDPMQKFLGVHDTMAIDRSGAGDEFSQKEIIVKQGIHHSGDIPATYDDLIHVIAPQTRQTGSALMMPGFRDYFLETAFENGAEGTAFEYELIYYPTTTVGGVEGLKLPLPDNVVGGTIADHGDDKEAYRWYWLIENNRDADDYRLMMQTLKVLGMRQGDEFYEQADQLLDVDNWLRSFAVQTLYGIGDNYSTSTGAWHNAVFYMRPDGKAMYFPYDMDFSFSQGATSALVQNTELRKLVSNPENEHMYLGHMHDILTTTFNNEYMDSWIDHYQNKLTSRQNFSSYKRYITQRHDYVLGQLPDEIPFAITTAGPVNAQDATTATLAGNGWVNVRQIRLAGSTQPLDVTWNSTTSWQATVPVNSSTPTVTLEAIDLHGNLIGTASVDVISTAANPVAQSLRISEINYNPHEPTDEELAAIPGLDNNDFEFVELQNAGTETINLLGVHFTAGIDYVFPAAMLAPGQYAVIAANKDALQLRYGNAIDVAGTFAEGNLSNQGERLALADAFGATVLDFQYRDADPWPEAADGNGATLQLVDANLAASQFGRYSSWRASTDWGGSPGTAGSPAPGVVINELLTNTDATDGPSDSIELLNTTDQPVDISGWYLSDSSSDLLKYRVPAGTILGPHAYIVFGESHFNPDPPLSRRRQLCTERFARRERVAGDLRRCGRRRRDRGPGADRRRGQRRVVWAIPGRRRPLGALADVTLGGENGLPRVGPLVISEINYAPAEPTPAALAIAKDLTSDDLEFIEIHNPTGVPVDLTNWQLAGGVDFEFPQGLQLEVGGTLVVVSFNPADPANVPRASALQAQYGVEAGIVLVGGYQGQLDKDGEMIRLLRPDQPPADDPALIPGLVEDEVIYHNADPWPTGAGVSLGRSTPDSFGNNPGSWVAQSPSPGVIAWDTVLPGDANQDGQFDQQDVNSVLASNKYLTGQPADFSEGDWNADGVFDQLDIVAALQTGRYVGVQRPRGLQRRRQPKVR